ncbi:MAG: fibronectin type III domain-containing protein [Deltaproteobacteria bacterium]|nr:fibronectin type III domain-containing protein [Deltaproteobacteria bacterium]
MKIKIKRKLVTGILLVLICLSLGVPASAQAFRLTLAWDPNTETDLTGYKIYIGNEPKKYSWAIDVGNRTTGTVDNLVEGTAYYFALTAYNSKGLESGFSNEIRFPDWAYKHYFPFILSGPQ